AGRCAAGTRGVLVAACSPERAGRVVIVLDTSRVSAGRVEDVPRLDSAMEAALVLTTLAARTGERVDLRARDPRVPPRLRLAGARDATSRLEDAMAALHPEI